MFSWFSKSSSFTIPIQILGFEKQPSCYDRHHKPNHHDVGQQRYVSPTTGKCKRLRVQSTEPRHGEVRIKSNTSNFIRTCMWLVENRINSFWAFFLWTSHWAWFLFLIWYSLYDDSDSPIYTGWYKEYPMEFWGQLWAARSEKEYSLRMNNLEKRELSLPTTVLAAGGGVKTALVTHALYPRQLMVYDVETKQWERCVDPKVNIRIDYLAISYRQTDFPDKVKLQANVEAACLELGNNAYWLDFLCIGATQEEKNQDLYRIADVFRGASKTLIMIRKTVDEPKSEGWLSWGDRIWTLPEALLSAHLLCKVGDGKIREISLRQVANFAYRDNDDEMRIINGYSGKDQLERLEKLSLLKEAIWRRSSSPSASSGTVFMTAVKTGELKTNQTNISIQVKTISPLYPSGSEFTAYLAEKVYALMGFFEHRILPDSSETELQALARLSLANDSDRIAERMVSMLPSDIKDQACWYSDHDMYGTHLWDIEPQVQAVGTSQTGALVLDGCRAACIRWKDFPKVAFNVKFSYKRFICSWLPLFFKTLFIVGDGLFAVNTKAAVALVVIGIVGLLLGPRFVIYSDAGRVLNAQPWLIGARGVVTAHQASTLCYGEDSLDPENPRITHTPAGSLLSRPKLQTTIRRGDSSLSEKAALELHRQSGNVYTLVDTHSDTIYYFTANRPPTVCVYTGREGGLGRFVLCSETCQSNELHKEAVLRMPTYISDAMKSTGWLAIGGLGGEEAALT